MLYFITYAKNEGGGRYYTYSFVCLEISRPPAVAAVRVSLKKSSPSPEFRKKNQ